MIMHQLKACGVRLNKSSFFNNASKVGARPRWLSVNILKSSTTEYVVIRLSAIWHRPFLLNYIITKGGPLKEYLSTIVSTGHVSCC